MAWVRVTPDGSWQSPITRYLSETEQQQIAARAGLRPGHLLLFIADRPALASDILGRLSSLASVWSGALTAHGTSFS